MKRYIFIISLFFSVNAFCQDLLPKEPKIDKPIKVDSCSLKKDTIFYTSKDIKGAPTIQIAKAMKAQDKEKVERLKLEFNDFLKTSKDTTHIKKYHIRKNKNGEELAKKLEVILEKSNEYYKKNGLIK